MGLTRAKSECALIHTVVDLSSLFLTLSLVVVVLDFKFADAE